MKAIKLFSTGIIAVAAVCSCNMNKYSGSYTATPTQVIITDGNGNNLTKIVPTYNTNGTTKTETQYTWSGSQWADEHEYSYSYKYGTGNMLTTFVKSEGSADIYKYDYSYNDNYILEYQVYTEYKTPANLVIKNKFEYDYYDGSSLQTRYIYVYDEDKQEYVPDFKQAYQYNLDGNVGVITRLNYVPANGEEEEGKYVEFQKSYYSYQNGYVSGIITNQLVGTTWNKYQETSYTYDEHGRSLTTSVETINLDVTPSTITKKVSTFYYPD